jgi:mannose-1-phosphate guanylyltransferase/mannose-6-phosphate isomerase
LAAQAYGHDPVLVVTPADQTVYNSVAFTQAMQHAVREAASGSLVVLGITPDSPETGYGYIQAQGCDPGVAGATLPVQRFVEKPDEGTVQQYLDAGGYYWNAGRFVLKALVWLNALAKFRPDMLQATRTALEQRREYGRFIRPGEEAFKAISTESIDRAVMENAPDEGLPVKIVPLDACWSDLGAWDAVCNVLTKDEEGARMWAMCCAPTATIPLCTPTAAW